MSRTSCLGNMSHTTMLRMTACTALLAVAMLPAAAQAQIAAARELYSQAITKPGADAESRAEQMYLALRIAQRCPGRSKAEKQLTAKIKKSLSEIDPLALGLLKIQERAARQMLKAAAKFADTGCAGRVESLLALALSLDASVDCQMIETIKSQLPPPNSLLSATFVDASLPYQGDSWKISEAGIESPPPQRRGQNVTTMLQSGRSLIGNYILSIEAQASTPTASFGIALGISGEGTHYHLLTLVIDGDDSKISLDRFSEQGFENLAVQPIRADGADHDGWLEIELTVQGGRISASIDGAAPLVVETQENLDGALGLFLAAGNHNSRATSFRHLQLHSIR